MQHTTREWRQLEASHHLHPFTDFRPPNKEGSRIITKAEGVYLETPKASAFWTGWRVCGASTWATAVRSWWMPPLARCSCPTTTSSSRPATPLLPGWQPCWPRSPSPPQTTSSSPARAPRCNDTVLRMVRHYWASKGQPDKQVIISRHNAYTAPPWRGPVWGHEGMHAQGGFAHSRHSAHRPALSLRCGEGMSAHEFGLARARQLEDPGTGGGQGGRLHRRAIQGAGASSFRPRATGPRSSASATSTASCLSPTR